MLSSEVGWGCYNDRVRRVADRVDGGLVGTSLAVAAGTVVSRITGFGRVAALAYALSFTRLTDAYSVANTTPNIVYELVLGGVLSATLVPVFVERLADGDDDEAWRAVSAVVTTALVVLVGLSVLLGVVAPAVIRLYTLRASAAAGADQQAVATTLLRFFAPQVLLYGAMALATALLNARRRFIAPMVAPVLNNLVVIAVLLAVPHLTASVRLQDVRANRGVLLLLGLGTTAGVALQVVALVPSLRRAGVRLRAVWAPNHPLVRRIVRLSAWTAAYVLANQVTLWLVLVVANGTTGGVSAYQAAYLFFQLPYAVVTATALTVLLPELAGAWATGDVHRFRARLSEGLHVVVVLLVPAAAAFVILARPVVGLAIEHGALTPAAAALTADVLRLFAVGLPSFGAYLLLIGAFQAMQDTRTIFLVYLVENALNAALAPPLHAWIGVPGLGLAFAVAYSGGLLIAYRVVSRRTNGLGWRPRDLARVAAAAFAMSVVVGVVAATLGGRLAVLVVAVPSGAVTYFATARLLGLRVRPDRLAGGARRRAGSPGGGAGGTTT